MSKFPVYASAILILLLLDYSTGSCVVCLLEELCCRFIVVVRTIKADLDFNIPVLLREGTFFAVILTILRALKRTQAKDKIDELLAKSREALKLTDDFMEKWRSTKIYYQKSNEFSYLDEEPEKIQPYKLEVPILHMAIINTTERNQFERGDAADTIYMSDVTVLSMTSLFDDLSMLSDEKDFDERNLDERNFDEKNFDEKNFDERHLDERNFDERNFDERNLDEKSFDERRLWNVTEEDKVDQF